MNFGFIYQKFHAKTPRRKGKDQFGILLATQSRPSLIRVEPKLMSKAGILSVVNSLRLGVFA
jgi:hypothetical protein